MSTFTDYHEHGTISAEQALKLLVDDIAEIEQVYERAEQARKQKRAEIEQVVLALGGKAQAGGYEMVVTGSSTVSNYDTKRLDAVVADLLKRGYLDIAQEIAECRKETQRAGSLRVSKERSK